MRQIRIYQPGSYLAGDCVVLSDAASLHVGTVLRMKEGDELTLFSGDNRECSAVITQVHKKQVSVNISQALIVNRESPQPIHLAQGISKGDKMEWVIQKAVELGVCSITPLLTEYCVVKLDAQRLIKKQAQWQAIAIAACEQSGRNQVPMIYSACSFNDYLTNCSAPTRLILHPYDSQSWRSIIFDKDAIALLIGPEGGFSEREVNQAKTQAFKALSLGPRVLRTETAAIAALSVLQAVVGDL